MKIFYNLLIVFFFVLTVCSARTTNQSKLAYQTLTTSQKLSVGERNLKLSTVIPANEQVPQSKSATIDASKFPNLQAAFDALPENGGEVIIPSGEYELTESLILTKGDVQIRGAGAATHIINCNQNGEPAIILRSPTIPNIKSDETTADIWRIQLSDFRVSGNINSGDGILLERVDEVYLSGLSVDHNGGHGINLTYCLEDPRVNHCIITYNGKAGMYIIGCHDIIVSANQFEENQDALQFIDGFNLTMTGNNIDDHLRHGVVIENTYGGCLITGNMIEECQGTAIILDRRACGTSISGNAIAHNLGGGLDLRDSWGCTVSANTFTANYNFSVFIGSKSSRHSISGNNISNSQLSHGVTAWPFEPQQKGDTMSRDGGKGIIMEGTSDIAITGNLFGGLEGEAVKADAACNRILVSGNIMTSLGQRVVGAKTAIDLGGAKESIVKDNIIEKGLIVK